MTLEQSHAAFQARLDARGVRKLTVPHDRSGWRRLITQSLKYTFRPVGAFGSRARVYHYNDSRSIARQNDEAAFAELERRRATT